MSDELLYIHLPCGSAPPEIHQLPSRFVVIVEERVTHEWQAAVSAWIVRSGCLYMMAWGIECTTWDDAVDWANIDNFVDLPIPPERLVITTWHDDEALKDVFWFSKTVANHPDGPLTRTVLLDISADCRRDQMLHAYMNATLPD